MVRVSFDLFVIESWDGDDIYYGPDIWDLRTGDGLVLLHTTFSNTAISGHAQNYPDAYPGIEHPAQTGAAAVNSLGYGVYGDALYELTFTFPHSADTLVLDFSGSGLQDLSDESWGLDNVRVGIAPPTTPLESAGR